ncbi:SDR family NAD(P)-dependent oxidoreductase [Limosilactobacillus vaginalis]|uniref:SDR family NAD(P)-dependent oxidoreductase n=1 Tax=Limosilactobacillus vaginalis TaxID=1633 RepID=UPI0025A325E7|nr:SDR family NAD(P)-dependent oxidoreductase [Limosilactobacillus vaginalis]MDM8244850.1 SDR family NAD(P)-dependent oxidoreductase [Limosilactobacillus vaginalis]MDM8259496.1 SDR family NAD(P)-dependent oxidoreductase [Limosilactobacillus vaginalis]MDM8261737.1 SDR family NAD(P)-dependent oxidoreductase [Limosilactobacillus vaginalis]MDM8265422.1 SDR family NAD(P)-dependent oxidoreductase [Limosilactobacillus vaginalis]
MKGNILVITGGLSGIGKGTALELAKENLTIIILDVQDKKAPDVIKQVELLGSECNTSIAILPNVKRLIGGLNR